MAKPKKTNHIKNGLTQMAHTFAPSNEKDYPIAYDEHVWDIVKGNTKLSKILGDETGQFDQSTINEALAGAIGGNGGDSGLDSDQLALLEWVKEHRAEILLEEAQKLFDVVKVELTGNTFHIDEVAETTMKYTIRVVFDGTAVTPSNEKDVLGNGWKKGENVGEYYKEATGGNGTKIPSQEFKYIIQSDKDELKKFNGLEVSKSSIQQSITAQYPIYYGFIPDSAVRPDATSTEWTSSSQTILSKIFSADYWTKLGDDGKDAKYKGKLYTTSAFSISNGKFINPFEHQSRFVIVTHGTADLKQLSSQSLGSKEGDGDGKAAFTDVEITQKIASEKYMPNAAGISGYKIYIAKNNTGEASSPTNSLSGAELKITA
jgi:hypothetical protein